MWKAISIIVLGLAGILYGGVHLMRAVDAAIPSGADAVAIYKPPQKLDAFVVDDANVLLFDQKKTLTHKLAEFQRNAANHPQVAVAIVKDMGENHDIKTYSQDLFRTSKLGQMDKNNGVLVVVAVSERKLRIHTGYGMEGIIPDLYANQIIKEKMVPLLTKGSEQWYNALDAGTDAIISRINSVKE